MTRNTYKIVFSILLGLIVATPAFAATSDTGTSNFRVDLTEILSVEVSSDTVSDTGQTNANDPTFLKDSVKLTVVTNNASGFSATMTTISNDTNLRNKASANTTPIANLDNNFTEANFPQGRWGFSLNGDVAAADAVYRPLQPYGSANPSLVARSSAPVNQSVDIYFGAKNSVASGSATASGTYSNSVVISVTAPPSAPEWPEDDPHSDPQEEPEIPSNPTNNEPSAPSRAPSRTIANTDPSDTPDTEEPSASDAHEEPQGVVEDTTETHIANSNSGMSLAAGATVTAAAGLIFFILAKRKEDEDEETK